MNTQLTGKLIGTDFYHDSELSDLTTELDMLSQRIEVSRKAVPHMRTITMELVQIIEQTQKMITTPKIELAALIRTLSFLRKILSTQVSPDLLLSHGINLSGAIECLNKCLNSTTMNSQLQNLLIGTDTDHNTELCTALTELEIAAQSIEVSQDALPYMSKISDTTRDWITTPKNNQEINYESNLTYKSNWIIHDYNLHPDFRKFLIRKCKNHNYIGAEEWINYIRSIFPHAGIKSLHWSEEELSEAEEFFNHIIRNSVNRDYSFELNIEKLEVFCVLLSRTYHKHIPRLIGIFIPSTEVFIAQRSESLHTFAEIHNDDEWCFKEVKQDEWDEDDEELVLYIPNTSMVSLVLSQIQQIFKYKMSAKIWCLSHLTITDALEEIGSESLEECHEFLAGMKLIRKGDLLKIHEIFIDLNRRYRRILKGFKCEFFHQNTMDFAHSTPQYNSVYSDEGTTCTCFEYTSRLFSPDISCELPLEVGAELLNNFVTSDKVAAIYNCDFEKRMQELTIERELDEADYVGESQMEGVVISQEEPPDTPIQAAGFIQQEVVPLLAHIPKPAIIEDIVSASIPWDMQKAFDKPMKLFEIPWTANMGTTTIDIEALAAQMADKWLARRFLEGFQWTRYRWHFTLGFNSTMFHQGLMKVTLLQVPPNATFASRVSKLRTMPGIEFQANEPGTFEMKSEVSSLDTMWELNGTYNQKLEMVFSPLSPLVCPSTGTQALTITVMAKMIDYEVKFPIPRKSGLIVRQPLPHYTLQSILLKNAEFAGQTQGHAASNLKTLGDGISSVANAFKPVSDGVKDVANVLKPIKDVAGPIMGMMGAGDASIMNQASEHSGPMPGKDIVGGIYNTNHLATNVGTEFGELKKIRTIHTTVDWLTAHPVNHSLIQCAITSRGMERPTTVLHPASIFGSMGTFAKGDINFHFRVIKNKILTGKIKIFITPPRPRGGAVVDYGSDSYEFPTAWIDLSGNAEANITIPYEGTMPYKRVPKSLDPVIDVQSDESISWGDLNVIVVNPLITNSAEFSTVPILIEISYGDNFEFFEPNTIEYSPHFYFSSHDAQALQDIIDGAPGKLEDAGTSQMEVQTSSESLSLNTAKEGECDMLGSQTTSKHREVAQLQSMSSVSQLSSRYMPLARGRQVKGYSFFKWDPNPASFYLDGRRFKSNNSLMQAINAAYGKWKGNIEIKIWTDAHHDAEATALVQFYNAPIAGGLHLVPHNVFMSSEPISFQGADDVVAELSTRGRKNMFFNFNRTPCVTFVCPFVSQTEFLNTPPNEVESSSEYHPCSLPPITIYTNCNNTESEYNYYITWRMCEDVVFSQYSGLGDVPSIPPTDPLRIGSSINDPVFPGCGGFWTYQFGQMIRNLSSADTAILENSNYIQVLINEKMKSHDRGYLGAIEDYQELLSEIADDAGESQMEVAAGFFEHGTVVMQDANYKLLKESTGEFINLYIDTFLAIEKLDTGVYPKFVARYPQNVGVNIWKGVERRLGLGEEYEQHFRNLVVRFHGLSGVVNGSWTCLGSMLDTPIRGFTGYNVISLSMWNTRVAQKKIDCIVEEYNEEYSEEDDVDGYQTTARPLPFKMPGLPIGGHLLATMVGKELRGEIQEEATFANIFARDRSIGETKHPYHWLKYLKEESGKNDLKTFLMKLLGDHYVDIKDLYPSESAGQSQMFAISNMFSRSVDESIRETANNANTLVMETKETVDRLEKNITDLTTAATHGVSSSSARFNNTLDATLETVELAKPLLERMTELTSRFENKSVIEGLLQQDFSNAGLNTSARKSWGLNDRDSVTLSHIMVDIVNYFYSSEESKNQAIWNGITHFLVSTGLHINAIIDGVTKMKKFMDIPTNTARDFISEAARAEPGQEQWSSQVGIEKISSIGAALAVFIGLAVYHKIPEGDKLNKQFDKLALKLRNIGFAGSGFRSVRDVFYPLIQQAIAIIIGTFMEEENPELGAMKELEDKLPLISEWYKKASQMEPTLEVNRCIMDPNLRDNLSQMIIAGSGYEQQLLVMKKHVQCAVAVRAMMVKLVKMSDEVNQMKRSTRFRYDPFCVFLAGSPGIGKSWISTKLATDLGNYFNIDPTNTLYTRTNTDHWDNYTKQFITYFDDFGQATSDIEFEEFITIKSEAPCPLKMASITAKGTTFESPVILCSSNNGYPSPKTIYDKEAFYRRRDIMTKVIFTGNTKNGEKQFRSDLSHLRFVIMDRRVEQPLIRKLDGKEEVVSMDYEEFREFIRIRMLMYFEAYYASCVEKGTAGNLIQYPTPEYQLNKCGELIGDKERNINPDLYVRKTAQQTFMYLSENIQKQDAGTSQVGEVVIDMPMVKHPAKPFSEYRIDELLWHTVGDSYGYGPVTLPFNVAKYMIKLDQKRDEVDSNTTIDYLNELKIKIPLIEMHWTTFSSFDQEHKDEYISKAFTLGDMSEALEFNKKLDAARTDIARIYMEKYENMFRKYPVLVTIVTSLGLVASVYALIKAKDMAKKIFSNKEDSDSEEEMKTPISAESSIGRRDPNNMGRSATKKAYTRMRPEGEEFRRKWNTTKNTKLTIADNFKSECKACPVIDTMVKAAEQANEHQIEQLWLDSIGAIDTIMCKVACPRCKDIQPTLKRLEEILKTPKEKAKSRLYDFSTIRSSLKACTAWFGISIVRLIDRLSGVEQSEGLIPKKQCARHTTLDSIQEYIRDLVDTKKPVPLQIVLRAYKLLNRSWPDGCERCKEFSDVEWADGFTSGFKEEWALKVTKQLVNLKANQIEEGDYVSAGVSEGCADANLISVRPLFEANLWTISCVHGRMNILFLQGTVAIMPLHFKSWVKDDCEITLTQNGTQLSARWMMRNIIKEFPMNDLMVVNVGSMAKPHKRIIKHFIRECDLKVIDAIPGMLCNRSFVKGEIERMSLKALERRIRPIKHSLNGKESLCVSAVSYEEAYTVSGQCGGIVLGISTNLPNKIIGLHIAGDLQGKGSCAVITQELLNEIDWDRNGSQLYVGSKNGIPKPPGIIYDEEEIKMKQNIFVPENTPLKFVGLAPKEYVVRTPQKSTLQRSPLYGVYPPTVAPAILHPGDPRFERIAPDGTLRMSPLQQGVDGWGMKVKPFKTGLVDEACRIMILENELITPQTRPRRVFGINQVINLGADVSPVANRMEMTTSPGLPWVNLRPPGAKGKEFLFEKTLLEDETHYFTPKKELKDAIEHRIAQYKKGKRPITVWCDMLKDEKLKLEKVKSARTRNFVIAPVDFNIVMRMYFRDFVLNQQEQCVKAESKIGLNPLGPQWTAIAERSLEIGSKFMAGDYSKFDRSETADHILRFADVVNAWYDDGEENFLIRKLICEECTHRLTVCGTTMYETAGGMPSGCDCTTPCNGCGGGINLRVGYIGVGEFLVNGAPEEFLEAISICPQALDSWKLAEEKVKKYAELDEPVPIGAHSYTKNVRGNTMGDDLFAALSDRVCDYFNFHTYRAFLGLHGVLFTPETKTGPEEEPLYKRIEDLTFLKRKFVAHPLSSHHLLAPLEWGVIEQEVQWIHKCDDVKEMTEQVVDASIRDAMHHGVDKFEGHLALMNSWLLKKGMEPNYHSYLALEKDWFLKFT